MNTLFFSALQAFQHFSPTSKIQFPKTCPKELIQFLSECIINLLQGNMQKTEKNHVLEYRNEIHALSLQKTTNKQGINLLSSQNGLLHVKTISLFARYHLL